MAIFEGVTSNGLIIVDTSDIKQEVIDEWRAAFGEDFIVDDETPQGVVIVGDTLARAGVVRLCARVANQINPNVAGGVWLDAICAFLGLQRRQAIHSVNRLCRFRGVPGANIPPGVRARDTNGKTWASMSAVMLDAEGTATADFVCLEPGPVACSAGSMADVLDAVLGWEGITNPTAALVGRNEQSDASLRTIRNLTLARQGVSISEAIISNLYDEAGVRSLSYIENYTSVEKEVNGITLPPHTVWVCCDGGTDEDIAQVLMREKTVGAGYAGTQVEVRTIDPVSGQHYDVAFDRPDVVNIEVRLVVRRGSYIGPISRNVVEAVSKYTRGEVEGYRGLVLNSSPLAGPQPTPSASPTEIASAVKDECAGLYVGECEIRILNGDWQCGELHFKPNELPVLERGNIYVEVTK